MAEQIATNAALAKIEEMTQAFKTLSAHVAEIQREKASTLEIEKLVKRATDNTAYYDPPTLDQSLVDTMPEKFNINELAKFHVTDHPKNFLRQFK